MSEGAQRTAARIKKSRWGWIWALPLATVLVLGWLAIQAFAHPGVSVEVLFGTAAGVQPGQTRVAYKGLDIGVVKTVGLADDHRHVRMTLFLKPDARPLLGQGASFWIVGAKPSLTDFNSLKSVFAGSTIEMEPGHGPPARRFNGLDQPPPVPPGTPGRRFVLIARELGPVRKDSVVYFHGLEAGKVVGYALAGGQQVQADVFVQAPFDRLVHDGSQFWIDSPLQISGGVQGLAAQVVSPTALVAGAVAFDTPPVAMRTPASAPGRPFRLYADRQSAEVAPVGPQVPFSLALQGDVGELHVGAPVRMRGFVVGQVTALGFRFDARTGTIETPVQVALEPALMHIQGPEPAGGDWAPSMDAAMARLVAKGLRARIAQSPPLVGDRTVDLDIVPGAAPARLVRAADGRLQIPSTRADVDDIMAKADQLLTRASAVPIQQIGQDLRQITARVRSLVSSPKLADSLDHLDSALTQVDQTVHQVAPQVGPLVAKLRKTADDADSTVAAAHRIVGGDPTSQDADLPSALHQLSGAARSMRALADYLERHPEAIIQGKARAR